MAAAKKRASLASDLLAAKPEEAVVEPSARRKQRSAANRPVLLDVKGEAEAATLRTALAKGGGLFSRKGSASAATFKPWYWSYDGENAGAPAHDISPLFEIFANPQQPVFPFEIPPAPPEPPAAVVEILQPAPSTPIVEDAQAIEERRHRTAFAEQLSGIIEGILASRDFAGLVGLHPSHSRGEREALAGPAGLLPPPDTEITQASLRAELAQARIVPEPEPEPEAEPAQKPKPWLDRIFLIGGALMVLATGIYVAAV